MINLGHPNSISIHFRSLLRLLLFSTPSTIATEALATRAGIGSIGALQITLGIARAAISEPATIVTMFLTVELRFTPLPLRL